MRAIEGSASYSGSAGGKYAVKTLTSGGEINSLRTGQFVADVELNANLRRGDGGSERRTPNQWYD